MESFTSDVEHLFREKVWEYVKFYTKQKVYMEIKWYKNPIFRLTLFENDPHEDFTDKRKSNWNVSFLNISIHLSVI